MKKTKWTQSASKADTCCDHNWIEFNPRLFLCFRCKSLRGEDTISIERIIESGLSTKMEIKLLLSTKVVHKKNVEVSLPHWDIPLDPDIQAVVDKLSEPWVPDYEDYGISPGYNPRFSRL